MTELLDRAVEMLKALTPEAQDDLARMMPSAAGQSIDLFQLTEDDIEAVARSRAAASRGDFASDEQVRAMWAKYGL